MTLFVGFHYHLLLVLVHMSARTGTYAAHVLSSTSKIGIFVGFVRHCLILLRQLWHRNRMSHRFS